MNGLKKVLSLAAGLASCAALSTSPDRIAAIAALNAPKFAAVLESAGTAQGAKRLAEELYTSPIAQIMPVIGDATVKKAFGDGEKPIVVTHGMGDSCFNSGMKQITKVAGDHAGVYSVCVPGGPNRIEDTLSGFLVNMNKNVDIFAKKVRADPKLSAGFNAIGLSQGNSVIRGYIQRYNNPPVVNYLGVHGTVMGVSGFPNCNPAGFLSPVCDALDEVLGKLAYAEVIQEHLFQSNYFRDPKKMNASDYLKNSQIAGWNNENTKNDTYTKNFESVNSMNMIKAMKDTMVFPNAGEWWGEFVPGQFKKTLDMKDSPLYTNFGLSTLDAASKIRFNTTAGEHLQFSVEQLEGWLDAYFA